ncbi:MAG TPA: hypothetical protein VI455_13600 [Terriglobia bacterium]
MTALTSFSVRAQQDDHKRKVPVIDKLSSNTDREAFSGLVQSLDLKDSLLVVHNTRDDTDEYFPFKKTVSVATATGKYLTLDGVKPGQSVLVYYDQKGNKRTVKEIVVLENAPPAKPAAAEPAAPDKDKPPPPS